MTRLAARTARIAASPTMAVTAMVDRLRREGVEVIDFGAGEPDFGTPDAVNAAAKRAIDRQQTKYTPVGGSADLKRAICAPGFIRLSYATSLDTLREGSRRLHAFCARHAPQASVR